MNEVRVRAGVAGDLAAVIALERAAPEAPHWNEADYALLLEDRGDYLRRCFFVAERDAVVIGFAVGKLAGNLAELESVAVDFEARRGGVGRMLCGAVIAWCRAEGAAAMELEVRAASEGAIGLYRGLGFIPTGRRPKYYSAPIEDAVLMHLDLSKGP